MEIVPAGEVYLYGGSATTQASLSGVAFGAGS